MEISEKVIKEWLTKLNEWEATFGTTGQYMLCMMTEKRDELTNFLCELEKILTNLAPMEILSQLPSIPKLLQALLNNISIQTTESLYQLVMKCITAVPISCESHTEKQNEIINKSLKWVKSQLKHACTSSPEPVDSLLRISEDLGLQRIQLIEEINKQLVTSLTNDISSLPLRDWNIQNREFSPTCLMRGTMLRNVSNMCLSIISYAVARPLVEALVSCHIGNDVMRKSSLQPGCAIQIEEALSPCFLKALNDQPKAWYLNTAKGIPFSYETRLGMWMRCDSYFEDEILSLVEVVCKERICISRNELRSIVSSRDLPKALSEHVSLFSLGFTLLSRVIYETKGSLHIMRCLGTLLESMNEYQRQKKLNSVCYINYAIIWSVQLSNLVSSLNIEWLDLPRDAFLHRIRTIERFIHQTRQEFRCNSYYLWVILQGFPTLLHKCSWVMLLDGDEFVDPCLLIQSWHNGGGTEIKDDVMKDANIEEQDIVACAAALEKWAGVAIRALETHAEKPGEGAGEGKIHGFVYSLRRLKTKREITTNGILHEFHSIIDVVPQGIGYLIRNLVLVFIFTSPSYHHLNIQDILSKLTEDMAQYYAIDFLLHWIEETWSMQTQSKLEWPYKKHFNNTSQAQFITFLRDSYKQFSETCNEQENYQIMFNLRQRFETIVKLSTKQA